MSTCDTSSDYNDQDMGARIACVFVMLGVSALGSFLPLFAAKYKSMKIPTNVLQLVKHFGTGIILATSFIHLLGEAQDNLSSECLGGEWEVYPWASAICLMGTFTMFSIELFVQQMIVRKQCEVCEFLGENVNGYGGACEGPENVSETYIESNADSPDKGQFVVAKKTRSSSDSISIHSRTADSLMKLGCGGDLVSRNEDVLQRITSIFLLEFGIVFHSVFVGLSLAIAGDEFKTLFVAISFHQFFEGIGLGSRFALAPWPHKLRMVPWLFSLLYSLTTPLGVAAGLGVRHIYLDNSIGSLLVVGIFDSFCAGLLLYNCLVELMAPDFLVDMQNASPKKVIASYAMLVLGTGAMALIGRWA